VGNYYQRVAQMLQQHRAEKRTIEPSHGLRTLKTPRGMKLVLISGLGALLALGVIMYVVDYAVIRYRMSTDRSPFGQVMVTSFYAIHQKNGAVDFSTQNPQPETCINSVLPHLGLTPCWYRRRHPEKRIDI
jgi:hypothetical protein